MYSVNIEFRKNNTRAVVWDEFLIRAKKQMNPIFESIEADLEGALILRSNDSNIVYDNITKHLERLYAWCVDVVSQREEAKNLISIDVEQYRAEKKNTGYHQRTELPLDMSGHITMAPHDSFTTSIVLSDRSNYPWYLSSFSQLGSCINYYDHRSPHMWVTYPKQYHGDSVYQYNLPSSELKDVDDVLSLVKDQLDNGCYCVAYLDEFYIRGRYYYEKQHFTHQSLIYGYDEDAKVLLAAGYRQKYGVFEIDQGIFNKSFKSGMKWFKKSGALMAASMALKFCKPREELPHRFTLSVFQDQLNDYLLLSEKYRDNYPLKSEDVKSTKYGIDIYDAIIDSLRGQYPGVDMIDIRTFQLLLEHKKGVLDRLRYLDAEMPGEFADEILSVEKLIGMIDANRFRYLRELVLLKGHHFYRPIHNLKMCRLIADDLEMIKDYERAALGAILRALNSKNLQPAQAMPKESSLED